jgi:hypothetical protein
LHGENATIEKRSPFSFGRLSSGQEGGDKTSVGPASDGQAILARAREKHDSKDWVSGSRLGPDMSEKVNPNPVDGGPKEVPSSICRG